MRISTSLAASARASSASQLSTRASIRYASRKATAGDHAARAVDGGCEVGPLALNALVRGCVTVLGTHRPGTVRPSTVARLRGSAGRPATAGVAGTTPWCATVDP